ncbi:MAG: DNA-binding domain-containing protein [Cyanobacteria bacterium P01_A01_bin.83]
MGKRQIAVRVPDSLLERLDNYVKEKKTSKTDVVIGALAQYLDSPENVPLGERMTAVEAKLAQLEAQLKAIETDN